MKRLTVILLIMLSLLQAQIPQKIKSKSIPLGIGLSSVLPGAGQWYAGNKGIAVLYTALEAVFIAGTVYFNHQGNLEVDAYEDFADLHWDVEGWLNEYDPNIDPNTHRSTVYVDNIAYSPEDIESYANMMSDIDNGYTELRIIRDFHFYENIGKYQQFKQGWDDWYDGSEIPGDPLNGISGQYSDNQYIYAGMRREANELLDFATYFGTAIFLNHFISAIDAGFRIKKHNENQDILFTLHTAPMIRRSGAVGIQTGIDLRF
jgi:hypothetical protein